MTDKRSKHISSITLLVYVFPVSCYSVYDCSRDDTYDFLHTKTNVLILELLDGTYILATHLEIFVVVFKVISLR